MPSNQAPGTDCHADSSEAPMITAHPNRDTHLDDLSISRALPRRNRRTVGPWCFLDRFGPLSFGDERPMKVPPHPHIGLQTVSWLLEGEVLHRDSLGSEAIVSPGGVNIMTAGEGIAHSEETPSRNSGRLSGVQLWVALPNEHRSIQPSFKHVAQVPVLEMKSGLIQLFAGSYNGLHAPVNYFSDILGADVQIHPQQTLTLELTAQYEYAVLLLAGNCAFKDQPMAQKTLYTFKCRNNLDITSEYGGRFLLIGGAPFPEKILMWWNFVARTPEEIRQARDDWETHRRFGEVQGTQLPRLSAPDLGHFAQPNPIS